MAVSPSQTLHWTQTISNTTWGHQLSFHPFSRGDAPVRFSSLWPDKDLLVATYKEANLVQCVYDLCKLLVVTNSDKSLDALLDNHVLMINHVFDPSKTTLAHLACAMGSTEVISVLVRRASNGNNTIWTQKDDEEHIPIDVCFIQKVRNLIPSIRFSFSRKKLPQGLPLKSEDRDRIFLMARNPDDFYKTIVNLQMFAFDVNRERSSDGDLLIHLAITGGLPQLPLLYALVSTFKADVNLKTADGLTPLCLAAKLGEEKIAEILVCVFGADINASCGPDSSTPLHYAVIGNHPRLVSMLVRRGADSAKEDKNGCEPSFLARKVRALECRQIISQHLVERTERLATEANNGTLDVSKLYPSDSFLVCSDGCTLVMMAAMNNRTEVLKELVKMDNCPLDFKQMKANDSLDSSSKSLSDSSSDNVHSLKSAVHFVAERGFSDSLQILMDAGAHPAIPDAAAWLPIHYASDNGHIRCVEVIINVPNQLGLSGLRPAHDIAKGNGYHDIVKMLEKAMERRQRELINPLLFEVAHTGNNDLLFKVLENGDDVNPINESNDWPLLLAAGFGYIDLVKQLHEFGGHVTRKHKISRSTPLHVAARGGHASVVRYLLRMCRPQEGGEYLASPLPKGANAGDDVMPQYLDINGRNAAGATPLELAASQGHLEVVRLLLDNGASTTLPDSNGRLINIPSFAGTQFLIETSRKQKRKRIVEALKNRLPLKEFKKIWQGPSDFNLRCLNGDSMLMVAAQFVGVDVLRYLIESAKSCQTSELISPDQTPAIHNYSSSQSEESFSENSIPRKRRTFHTQSISIQPTHRRTHSAHEYDEEEEDSDEKMPPKMWTAIGGRVPMANGRGGGHSSDVIGVKSPIRERLMADLSLRNSRRRPPNSRQNSRQMPVRPLLAQHPPPSHGKPHFSSTTTPSSDDDGDLLVARDNGLHGNGVPNGNGAVHHGNGATGSDSEGFSEEFISLVRYANPHDGQTLLHRAALGCQTDNVTLLLHTDTNLANVQDNYGNTALQIACSKAHKQTVKALLSFSCVSTTVRNNNGELPEAACMKTAIRKLVCKQRTKEVGDNLPSPPQWKDRPRGLPSVERAPPNSLPSAIAAAQLSEIPESPDTTASSSLLSESQFQARLEELKTQVQLKRQNGAHAGMTNGASAGD